MAPPFHPFFALLLPSAASTRYNSMASVDRQSFGLALQRSSFGAQRLINLEVPVLVRSLKSSKVELG